MKFFAMAIGAALAATASATCPFIECNYLDPKYVADFKSWSDCANAYVNRVNRALEGLAVLFPRFGIAYRAYTDDVKAAMHSDGTLDQVAVAEAKRRFDDRILHTAEAEALQDYNMILLSEQQHPMEAQCGVMPEPPRKLPP